MGLAARGRRLSPHSRIGPRRGNAPPGGGLVDERVRELPELAPYRTELTAMLRKMAKDAYDHPSP
ncbi:hypothetical protein K5X85_20715 [Streptomyces sp. A144]|uniref:Uncharacterized protein n=1 Tax=Streptomyces vinaceusdrappus TaxID=67376 RepID=A0ABY6BWS9_9ACTN|nr:MULTISPECIES: hypothetical protein [Streptomyces]UAX55254.1 hypothetical protein K5X85_20715 [Streptomyces sp. A144]UXI80203.1 hypothetical protein N6Q81_20350 [Streptomyces vinaceusdrappus]